MLKFFVKLIDDATKETRGYSLPIFTANETITNFTQYEWSQEESDLLKAGLYFSI